MGRISLSHFGLLTFAGVLASCTSSRSVTETVVPEPSPAPRLEALGIRVEADSTRPFVWTNKEAAYFYGEAAGPHRTAWQGFNVRGFVFADDWLWETEAGRQGADDLAEATVFPHEAFRRYRSGLTEKITLLDRLDALVVQSEGDGVRRFRPLVADSRDAAYFDVRAEGNVLLIARRNHPARRSETDHPVWLAVAAEGATAVVGPEIIEGGGVDGALFSPGFLSLPGASAVVLAVGDTPEETRALAEQVLREREALKMARRERMQGLLNDSYIVTQDERFNRAFAWTRLSMDALVMNQRGKGIFAGLPWFNNYWGRDSFIALPGALLVTGQWEEARDVLLSFGRFQNTDASSIDYGRIPNRVTLDDIGYNTADGTPWFVIQAAAYLRHADDPDFLREMWPVVQRAAEGSLRRTDAHGFLVHGDQETWMDASAGPGLEWTPRGDRALEIQTLFLAQLRATGQFAHWVGEAQEAERYYALAERGSVALRKQFFAPDGMLYDHLNADGTPDAQVRPNVFLALRHMRPEPRLTRTYAERLVYPWGVASLWQEDEAFHPYHEAPEFYPKDAAYHNGTIWTWLSGPLVSLMVDDGAHDLAYEQLQYLTHLALERGAIGAMAENSDAFPRDGAEEPKLTGTVTQAWTLAEYLRNAYEDFAGIHYSTESRISLAPHLPSAWGQTHVRFRVGSGHVDVTYTPGDSGIHVAARRSGGTPRDTQIWLRRWPDRSPERLPILYLDRGPADLLAPHPAPDTVWQGFRWQTPRLRENLRSLQGPTWPLLTREAVKPPVPMDARMLLDLDLPEGDDRGPTGDYTYPTSPQFRPGIFDATKLTIREDSARWYFDLRFRDLVQPGWNPQYGFQLTFAALVFGPGGGPMEVPRDAKYTVHEGYRYVVFVGGGLRVEDNFGNVLAEYRPAPDDVRDPLGDVTSRRISFSLPKTVLPDLPVGTPVTLLVGGQDDHGGAGIGDFRAVETEASEWWGGGKPYVGAPNVYDVARGTLE